MIYQKNYGYIYKSSKQAAPFLLLRPVVRKQLKNNQVLLRGGGRGGAHLRKREAHANQRGEAQTLGTVCWRLLVVLRAIMIE